MMECGVARVQQPGNRRRAARIRRTRQRNMAFAGKQAGSGIKPDPSRARKIDLRPRVQIREIRGRPAGPSSGFTSGTI